MDGMDRISGVSTPLTPNPLLVGEGMSFDGLRMNGGGGLRMRGGSPSPQPLSHQGRRGAEFDMDGRDGQDFGREYAPHPQPSPEGRGDVLRRAQDERGRWAQRDCHVADAPRNDRRGEWIPAFAGKTRGRDGIARCTATWQPSGLRVFPSHTTRTTVDRHANLRTV